MEEHIRRYKKYIYELIKNLDLNHATYKEHLHKVFEYYGCIQLSQQSGRQVLRWEDIPADLREQKNMQRDMGIDAWDVTGDRVIQMKLYNGCINWTSFSTFWSCCFTSFDTSIKTLFRNTESKIHSMIQTNINQGKLEDITVTDIKFRNDCKVIQNETYSEPIIQNKSITIRPYQYGAIQMIEQARLKEKNIRIQLPTGTGKTVVILADHENHRHEKIFILVPIILLMEQWNDVFIKKGFETYLIGTGQHNNFDAYCDQSVVICVYDSFMKVYNQVRHFNHFVIDEAHHVLTPERYVETEQHFDVQDDDEDDEDIRPNSYMKCIRDLSQTNHVIYLSATIDKPNDDSLFYEYAVRQAIIDKYLCDYQLIFPIFQKKHTTNQPLADYLIHQQQESHCLIYASNCKEGKEFTEMMNTIQKGCAGYIDGNTSINKRKKLLADFESGKIRFLVNIRVLIEGFDAPHIRAVFFLHISSSDIFIIQAIGRTLRPHPDKIKANVYVPFIQEDDEDKIHDLLRQLSSYDERIKQSIIKKQIGGYISIEHIEKQEDCEELQDSQENEDFEFRYNLIVDRMGNSNQLEEIAIKRAMKYKAFYEEIHRKPSHVLNAKNKENTTKEQKYEHSLALWFSNMQVAKKGKVKNCRLYSSVEKILIDLLGDNWYKPRDLDKLSVQRALEFKAFYEKNQRKPVLILSGKTKEQNDNASDEQKYEQRLAVWFAGMKRAKKFPSRGRTGVLYPSVEKILIKLLGNTWYDKTDFEDVALKHAVEYKTFYEEKQRYPIAVLSGKTKEQKDNATEDQKYERKLALWLQGMKTAKRGVHHTRMLYPTVEKFLIKLLGKNWCSSLEDESLKIALEYKAFYQEKQRNPSKVLNGKKKEQKDNATEEQKYEQKLAVWLGNMKSSKKGKARMNVYPSVEEMLVEILGENWYC
jgi:superfamily II DNA or RNA helicase